MNPSAEAIADSEDYADEGEPASRFVGIEILFGASPRARRGNSGIEGAEWTGFTASIASPL